MTRAAPDLFPLLKPALHLLAPEAAHRAALLALRAGLVPPAPPAADLALTMTLWGRTFANPVGLAAGFDKDAVAVAPLLRLGFGFVEVGTLTPRPQPGNPRPRVFRLPDDGGMINRLGFNNGGVESALRRLKRLGGQGGPVGVNIGPNRSSPDPLADCAAAARAAAPVADYLVVNVSSPNTPGLRDLQKPEAIKPLISAVRAAAHASGRSVPLLVKIAPDLTEADLDGLADTVADAAIDGIIATNTTVSRPDTLRSRHRGETGGLSGAPLFPLSTAVLARLRLRLGGRLPLIGVGGISSGDDAYEKIRAGASLIQLYTALIYRGPALIGAITARLGERLRQDGFPSLADAVGSGAQAWAAHPLATGNPPQ